MNVKGFSFNGIASEEFNLIVANFSSGYEFSNTANQFEFTTSSNPIAKRWRKTGNAMYQSPITFKIDVIKSNFEEFDSYEIAAIERWLCRLDDYKEFNLFKEDYDEVTFNATCTLVECTGTSRIYGLTLNFTCDAPFGYGSKVTYSVDTTNEEGEVEILDLSDEVGYIYPDVTIQVNSDCDISITNSVEDREFTITDCLEDEIINISGSSLQISSNKSSHILYDCTNFQYPRISNTYETRKNVFTVTGDCSVTFTYRPIRKVGL